MPGVGAGALPGDDVDLSTVLPAADPQAVRGLKFAEILPPRLAAATLAERMADRRAAGAVLEEARITVRPG